MIGSRRRSARQSGFSVTELLVAITVSLILLAGVIQLLVSNKQAYRLQENTSVLNENARFAVQRLSQLLRMGSHWGGASRDAIRPHSDVSGHSDTCTKHLATSTNDTNTVLGIEGVNGAATSPFTDCVSNADYVANSDIILVRYSNPNDCVDSGDLGNAQNEGRLWVRSAVAFNAVVFEGEDLSDVTGANPALQDITDPPGVSNCAHGAYVLYLRPCQRLGTGDVCDASLDSTPTLVLLRLDGTTPEPEELVAGVEQMQVVYGEDFDNDGAADRYVAANSVSDWSFVVSLRVNLLIRNLERDVAYNGPASVNMLDGFTYSIPTDERRYRRKQYTVVIQVRNMSRG